MLKYTKPERISLRDHAEYDERWLPQQIADDPSILGLGELTLLTRELLQPTRGRLDILLREPASNQRYEVEIQLGKTDEASARWRERPRGRGVRSLGLEVGS